MFSGSDREPAGLFAGKLINYLPKGGAFNAIGKKAQKYDPSYILSFLKAETSKSGSQLHPDA